MRKKGVTKVGETYIPEAFVTVRWTWLAFVAAQVGLSILFLVCIACHTARLGVDVVKSSNMSELFALGHVTAHTGLPLEALGIRPLLDPNTAARLRTQDGRWELKILQQPVSFTRAPVTSMRW